VEERLALLARFKRKYAPTIQGILDLREVCDRDIEKLEHAADTQEFLRGEQARLTKAVQALGGRVSERRQSAAQRMEQRVMAELADLAMPATRFHVALSPLPEPAASGLEKVEFQIAPNQGEGLLPLGRVASGGELSRIMLALKKVAPELEGVPTVVFDEVDAGIGGATATSVGRKLFDVSRTAQVICVTHLPQVAAFADRHFSVAKKEAAGRTLTTLTRLGREERVHEMARMLGGANITERTLDHARELIAISNNQETSGEHL
jgi:DNA repair protein RecN (Recombination protein N)